MANNPTYSMSIDDSIKSAYDFIDKVGDQTIDQTMETEFDEFLINLISIIYFISYRQLLYNFFALNKQL